MTTLLLVIVAACAFLLMIWIEENAERLGLPWPQQKKEDNNENV